MTKPHPIQNIYRDGDGHGQLRFQGNAIVRFLLDAGPYDMNKLAMMPWSNEDRCQFAQLIGYSLGGYGELHYVSDEELRRVTGSRSMKEFLDARSEGPSEA